MKRGLCNKGRSKSTLQLIRLDYHKTKEYNYYCKLNHIYHLSYEAINYFKEVPTLFKANLTKHSTKIFLNFLLFAFIPCFFISCAKPIVEIQTQEVFIPIKCNLELPQKPKENGSFESHKALSKYYLEVEQIAKDCTNE
ncbi:hypothetical protein [Helicobacter sp.]|uniref:hypothetical protein n=1 Tax=Helicobacter sp. TaxID=218 RepID=UPI0025C3DD11|nr:hypothetical protein [Helicobacter sp.]MCI5968181.1 hypothetical protein [Helicobacter sp.]